jgi:hypothetical protein
VMAVTTMPLHALASVGDLTESAVTVITSARNAF